MVDFKSLFAEANDKEILKEPRNTSTKRIFIAATRMNDGKTTTSLGLYSALNQSNKKIGFIKPVGQRFVDIGGEKIDEDCLLLDETFNVATPMQAMSPIVVDKDFTKNYLDNPKDTHPHLINNLCRAFDRAAYQKDYIIIEGTGHAGVGSVFNLSNAEVAKTLDAKAIIIASGGIGRPIDEIALNQALFAQAGVDIIGVIINKVEPDKMDFIKHYCGIALKRMNLNLLGCLPVSEQLSMPSLSQVFFEIKGQWLNQINNAESKKIKNVIIGAKASHGIISEIQKGTLIITPSDREDIIESLIEYNQQAENQELVGVILTNGLSPKAALLEKIRSSKIPFIISNEDSFAVTTRINKMTIKTQPKDCDKISIIKEISKNNLNLKEIEKAFKSSL
jgi:BioD-like phosphotransacetylase family protein